jgi:hypothetical protein
MREAHQQLEINLAGRMSYIKSILELSRVSDHLPTARPTEPSNPERTAVHQWWYNQVCINCLGCSRGNQCVAKLRAEDGDHIWNWDRSTSSEEAIQVWNIFCVKDVHGPVGVVASSVFQETDTDSGDPGVRRL